MNRQKNVDMRQRRPHPADARLVCLAPQQRVEPDQPVTAALEAADRAFLVAVDDNEVEQMTVVWDLEGAEPVTGLSAA